MFNNLIICLQKYEYYKQYCKYFLLWFRFLVYFKCFYVCVFPCLPQIPQCVDEKLNKKHYVGCVLTMKLLQTSKSSAILNTIHSKCHNFGCMSMTRNEKL